MVLIRIDGTNGNDIIDTIDLGNTDEEIYGWDGNDTIWAWTGNDFVYGGNGNDVIMGESGNDSY